jgi:glycogen phosphorylase
MAQISMTQEGPTPVPRGRSAEDLAAQILEKLTYSIGKDPIVARRYDWLRATILAVRDRVIDTWMESTRQTWRNGDKRVYYFSMEFLIGRLMRDVFSNVEMMEPVREALKSFDVELDTLLATEPDAALGNGGLGRLAACFLEACRRSRFRLMATASATCTACSGRRRRMAGRWKSPKTG